MFTQHKQTDYWMCEGNRLLNRGRWTCNPKVCLVNLTHRNGSFWIPTFFLIRIFFSHYKGILFPELGITCEFYYFNPELGITCEFYYFSPELGVTCEFYCFRSELGITCEFYYFSYLYKCLLLPLNIFAI